MIRTTIKSFYIIRPLNERDIPQMRELFVSTVLNVNIRDYTGEEAEDWASCGESIERWKYLLSHHVYFGVFDVDGNLTGFSSMNRDGYMHSMFVHKDRQGTGIATALLSEAERIASGYGVSEMTSEVSITARPFFEKRGFRVVRAQKQRANRLVLTNFLMRKIIG